MCKINSAWQGSMILYPLFVVMALVAVGYSVSVRGGGKSHLGNVKFVVLIFIF